MKSSGKSRILKDFVALNMNNEDLVKMVGIE